MPLIFHFDMNSLHRFVTNRVGGLPLAGSRPPIAIVLMSRIVTATVLFPIAGIAIGPLLGGLADPARLMASGPPESAAIEPSATERDRTTDEEARSDRSIRLVIDYGDGVEKHFTRLRWREGLRVVDLMEEASRHPRGIQLEMRGRRATSFLVSIDGIKNEGLRGRNWTYRRNGKLGDRGIGTQPVTRGDTILWRFETYE